MPIEILMPALSPTMTEGSLAKWIKKEGDKISPGDIIAEIETDKAIMEVEAIDDGVLGKIFVSEGTHNVKVNSVIGVIAIDGEDISNYKPKAAPQQHQEVNVAITPVTEKISEKKIIHHNDKRIFISPLAKKVAENNNVDIKIVNGSGPNTRIVKDDIFKFLNNREPVSSTVAATDKRIEVTTMRKVIAQRLLESKTTVPHFYLSVDCDVTELLNFRQQINKNFVDLRKNHKITVNDMVVKAVSHAMADFPAINSSWMGDHIIQYGSVDISIAVALEDGLITPIVRSANTKSLVEISNEIKSLVKKAQEGKLKTEEFQGGGFSVSNLGMYGIDQFFAIVNPPQAAILSVGGTIEKPVVMNGEIKIRSVMSVGLSCDHRVVDGALSAEFLRRFRVYIENSLMIFC